MEQLLKLISLVCGCIVIGASCGKLPSSITPCSRSLPVDQLTRCITDQGRNFQQTFVKGFPELGLESLDPLSLTDISAKTGTFSVKSTNVVVKGLKKAEVRELKWDLQKKAGHTKIYGNFTFLSDYETDGRVLLIPITGTGKLTVKMYNTEFLFKYKIRTIKGEDGDDHIETYDLRASQKYGNVKIHMSNILGGAAIGDTVNQVMNDNWRELMAEVGPPFTKAVSDKVHDIINKFYLTVPADELMAP